MADEAIRRAGVTGSAQADRINPGAKGPYDRCWPTSIRADLPAFRHVRGRGTVLSTGSRRA